MRVGGTAPFVAARIAVELVLRLVGGDPLGDEEVRLTKRNYGWPENETFLVPEGVYEAAAKRANVGS